LTRRVAVLGAAAARAGSFDAADEVLVLDPSPDALLALLDDVRDARWSFQLGALPVLPLPDGFVHDVVGGDDGDEVRRVRK
jgi:hypothetical protein